MPETENSIISELLDDVSFKENICAHFTNPVQPAEYSTLPDTLDDRLASILKQSGIDHLYNHQRFAWDAIQQKQHTVISTGVASGKSLCYQLPLLQSYLEDSESRAILLFPTKALAQDQRSGLEKFNQNLSTEFNLRPPGIGVYDGDLPSGQRDAVRKTASFIFTNPDMLHFGILPHHTQWAQFLRNLKYIIIDEVHVYRGIFGSHFTNVIRRLKRIASFYGAIPQFIITSATLANSHTYINALIEEEAVLISSDTAPHGESHFLIYNPPLLNEELGIRKPAMEETVSIARQLLRQDLQTLVFAQTRKAVELILSSLHLHTADKSAIVGYRSGYLPQERRQIEEGLRNGKIRMVVATNALELGIDIGGIDVVLLNGYPGSITSTRQQAGRAGRKGLPSAAILVASAGLLDQYLARNPDYLIHGNIEAALINPDNPYILFHHLQCALFEKTFQKNESFGKLSPEKVREFFQLLEKVGKLHHSQDEYFWSSTSYPANDISLRTAGADNYILQTEDEVIGIVDQESAFWMAHPGAVYIHNGSPYLVDDLDIEHHKALLKSTTLSYITYPMRTSTFELLELQQKKVLPKTENSYGQIQVENQVTGYKKVKWETKEQLGVVELDMPSTQLITMGCWFAPDENLVNYLRSDKQWSNDPNEYGPDWKVISTAVRHRDSYRCQNCGSDGESGKGLHVHHKKPLRAFISLLQANALENLITLCPSCHRIAERNVYMQSGLAGLSYLLGRIAPLFLMCTQSDLQVQVLEATALGNKESGIVFYDDVPGGIGLSEEVFPMLDRLFNKSLQIVENCSCKDGCPACVGPVAENGTGAKHQVAELLNQLVETP